MLKESEYNISFAMLFAGLLSMLLGATVIHGWYVHNILLIQLSPSFVPMQFNTALCFILSGIATILLFFNQKNFSIICIFFLVFITSLTMLQYFIGINLGVDEFFMKHYLVTKTFYPGRMSPNSAICFLLYGSMLYLITLRESKSKLLWILNSLLLAFCTLAFLGYVLNIEVVFGWQKYTRMALHTSVGFLLLALGSYIQVIRMIMKENRINLIPLPIGTLLLVVFFTLASALKHKDYLSLKASAIKEQKILIEKINSDLGIIIEAFNRMSRRISYLENNDNKFWILDTESYLNDYKFYKAIEFSDVNHIIRKINPLSTNQKLIGYNITHNETQKQVLEAAIEAREIRLTNVQKLIQGGRGFLILSPLFVKEEFIGTSIAVVDIDLLFESLFKDTLHKDYNISILENENEIFYKGESREEQKNWDFDEIFLATNNNWKISLVPKKEYYARNDSNLPEVIIFIGVLISISAGFFAYYTDRLKSLKEESEASGKAKSMFLANMSHEIRTPMNAIVGLTSVLKEEIRDKELLEKIEIISASGQSLLSIINDILDISKIESGNYKLQTKIFHFNNFLSEQVTMFNALASQRKIAFIANIGINKQDYIVTDDLRLKQILNNLISNALKFTTHGQVVLSVKIEENIPGQEDRVVFSVSDSGIGISEEGIGKLFKDFSQIDESSSRRFTGTGLGLSISKKFVELLGGEISVTSEVNIGSVFKFWIPFTRGNEYSFEAVDTKKLSNMDLARDLPLSILTVDDNKINLRVASELLKKIGYNTDLACNGSEALELLKTNRYDIIFMDCHMPILDGFETTQMIINIYGNKRPKIIALTASSMDEDIKKCFTCGMDDFISKPVSFKSFLDVLIKYGEKDKK